MENMNLPEDSLSPCARLFVELLCRAGEPAAGEPERKFYPEEGAALYEAEAVESQQPALCG
jgi:hypothetical protein